MKEIKVTAALILNSQGEILLAQRASPEYLRGLWEFPGGKIEAGESAEHALIREIKEELDMAIQLKKDLGEFHHEYPNLKIALRAFTAASANSKFENRFHLDVRWVAVKSISEYPLAPADVPICEAFLNLNTCK